MKFKLDSIQVIDDETVKADPRAIKVKPQDLIDRSLLDKLQKNSFFDKLWTGKINCCSTPEKISSESSRSGEIADFCF